MACTLAWIARGLVFGPRFRLKLFSLNTYINYSSLLLEYTIRKVQETRLGLDMNSTHQVPLVNADDENLMSDDIRKIEKNTGVLLNACKDIGLAVNTRETKYIAG